MRGNIMMRIEQEMDICVNEIGGIKISSMIGSEPSFLNADYLFNEYNVIAELKSLEEDIIKSEKIKLKATEIYNKYLSQNLIPRSSSGKLIINDSEYPENFKYEMAELYRSSIHTCIKKANNQIKETKKNLHLENSHGLLILGNDNHTALEPALAMWILSSTFKRYSFSSIDSIIYFTANVRAKHSELQQDTLIWIPSHRGPNRKCPAQLTERLQRSWIKRFSLLTKGPVFEIQAKSIDEINKISNI